jgi:hypothetical protein
MPRQKLVARGKRERNWRLVGRLAFSVSPQLAPLWNWPDVFSRWHVPPNVCPAPLLNENVYSADGLPTEVVVVGEGISSYRDAPAFSNDRRHPRFFMNEIFLPEKDTGAARNFSTGQISRTEGNKKGGTKTEWTFNGWILCCVTDSHSMPPTLLFFLHDVSASCSVSRLFVFSFSSVFFFVVVCLRVRGGIVGVQSHGSLLVVGHHEDAKQKEAGHYESSKPTERKRLTGDMQAGMTTATR